MADETDADKLRKQIDFLSSLINSHKNEKAKTINKTNVSSVNTRRNTSWSRWKNQSTLRKSESPGHHSSVGQTKAGSHSTTSSKTTIPEICQNKIIPPNKFSYRKQPSQTSTIEATNKCRNFHQLKDASSKIEQTVVKGKEQGISKTTMQDQSSRILTTILNPHNKYKLNRKSTSRTRSAPTLSTNLETQTIVKPLLQQNQSMTNLPKTSTSSDSNNKVYLLTSKKKEKTVKEATRTCVSKQTVPVNTTQPVIKGSKLKWRRKSLNQLKPIMKKAQTVNTKENTTVQKGAKLKWRRRSLNQLRPVTLKKAKAVSDKETSTIPKASKLKWRRKSLLSSASSCSKHLNTGPQKQRKTQLVHKSKYSIKRVDANQTKLLRRTGPLLAGRVLNRKRRTEYNNKSFVARRLKYIANHSCTGLPSSHVNTGSGRTVNIRGMKYTVRSDKKTLRKIHVTKTNIASSSYVFSQRQSKFVHNLKSPSKFSRPHLLQKKFTFKTVQRQNSVNKYKTERAYKILRRTIQTAQASLKKDKSKQYCMFYNKFGKCAKQKQGVCPYIHDPTKIAVCTRFLRGMCQQMDGTCPFSHKIDKEKMPICQYFLKGKCTRDDCPYSHVNVGRNAQICQDFLKGYCAQGFKCKNKHVLECEEFNTTGKCPNGKKCKLLHRTKTQKRKRYFQEEIKEPAESPMSMKVKKRRHRNSDGFLPLEDSTSNNTGEETEQADVNVVVDSQTKSSVSLNSLKIRPKFTSTTD